MTRNNKNIIRIIAVVLMLVIAAAIAFVLMPKLYDMEGATERIVMLTQNVSAGTQITEEMVVETDVGSYGLSPTTIKDRSEVVGKYATQNIYAKDLLFPEKLTTDYREINKELDPEIQLKDGDLLVTIELSSIAAGAAGKILPGDIVKTAVYKDTSYGSGSYRYSYEGNTGTESTASLVTFPADLQNLTVYRVRTAALCAMDPSDTNNGAANGRIPSYITLVVNEKQAAELLEYSYSGIVHFVEVE